MSDCVVAEADLRELAERATPGEWIVHPANAYVVPVENLGVPICALLWPTKDRTEAETLANAEFIAAANPSAILALLAERDALQSKYDEEYKIVDRCWKALGITTYEQAGGKAIHEIIAAVLAERDAARTSATPPEPPITSVEQFGLSATPPAAPEAEDVWSHAEAVIAHLPKPDHVPESWWNAFVVEGVKALRAASGRVREGEGEAEGEG